MYIIIYCRLLIPQYIIIRYPLLSLIFFHYNKRYIRAHTQDKYQLPQRKNNLITANIEKKFETSLI